MTPGRLVSGSGCSWVSCSPFLSQLVGPSGPSHHPKDHDTPKLPCPDRGCRLQEDRSCGPGKILGGDPKGLGVTLGRRGFLLFLSLGRQVAAPDPQMHSPSPHLGACRGAHRCKAGSPPGGQGVKSSRALTSPGVAWSGCPEASRTHCCTDQPPVGPSLLLLFHLPNYQAEVAV